MAKEDEEKKNKKFRIKWWWDSEDEEKARENSTYAEGLEKTDDAIRNKDMTKDEILEKKDEILEKTLENADHADDQQRTGGPSNHQDGKLHTQNSRNTDAVQNSDGPRKFNPSEPTNTGESHKNRNDFTSAGNTTLERSPSMNEGNQSRGGGSKRSEDGDEKSNVDKAQKSSFFNWFGGGNDDKHGDADNKESGAAQGSRNKDEHQTGGEKKVPEGGRPSHISWSGKENAQDGRRDTDEHGNNRNTNARPSIDDNAKMRTDDAHNSELDRNPGPSTKDGTSTSHDTGGKEQNRASGSKSRESASWFGFGSKGTPNDENETSLDSRGNPKAMRTDASPARRQDNNGDQRKDTNAVSKENTPTNASAENSRRQDNNGDQRKDAGPDLRKDKSAQEPADCKSTILFCGYINLCLVFIFLFYTEILRDCTVMFNTVALICLLLAANLPFLLFICSRGRASSIISIISVIATVLILVYLYMHRVRVYFYQISIDNTASDRLLQIQDQPWSERTPSVLDVLRDNGIYLEDWIRSSKRPGAKIFVLKHVLEFNDSQYQYLNSMAEKSLKEQVRSLSPYENGAIITFPLIKYSWSKEKALEILKEVASMKFSKIGTNYVLIVGIYPNTFDYSEIFGTEPVNIGRIDARSTVGEFDPMKENPKI